MKMNWGVWVGLIGGGIGFIIGAIAAISANPVSGTILFLILGAVFFSIYWFLFRPMVVANKILKTGIQKQGKIIDYADTNVTINNNPQVKFTIELLDDYNRPYQVKINKVISRLDTGNVHAGMQVLVRVDQNNKMKVAIESFGTLDNFNTTGGQPSVNLFAQQTDTVKAFEKILQENEEKNKKILYNGISAEAKIISAVDLGPRVNGENPFMHFYLEVHPGLKEPFYAEAKGVIAIQSVYKYQPGKIIYVKYLADDHTMVTIEHS
ncbi:MAG: hypothetical protein H7Y00_03500 [Fimbriimonadaceae bacterium]|nr:hypothetical protein [Chitinophagales bacterium]